MSTPPKSNILIIAGNVQMKSKRCVGFHWVTCTLGVSLSDGMTSILHCKLQNLKKKWHSYQNVITHWYRKVILAKLSSLTALGVSCAFSNDFFWRKWHSVSVEVSLSYDLSPQWDFLYWWPAVRLHLYFETVPRTRLMQFTNNTWNPMT